jgi:hypothetical protein
VCTLSSNKDGVVDEVSVFTLMAADADFLGFFAAGSVMESLSVAAAAAAAAAAAFLPLAFFCGFSAAAGLDCLVLVAVVVVVEVEEGAEELEIPGT